jgi:mannose-6-phosphate isomerase-like protein (cupin superfamily)
MNVVRLEDAFTHIPEFWSPRIAGEINDSYVKLARLKGKFVWHHHEVEDELFLVLKGRLVIHLRDRDLVIHPGEFVVIPHGVEHCPVAEEEVHVLLLEPKTTLNTGQVRNERTVEAGWLPGLEPGAGAAG